jgi:hypothetical protein
MPSESVRGQGGNRHGKAHLERNPYRGMGKGDRPSKNVQVGQFCRHLPKVASKTAALRRGQMERWQL